MNWACRFHIVLTHCALSLWVHIFCKTKLSHAIIAKNASIFPRSIRLTDYRHQIRRPHQFSVVPVVALWRIAVIATTTAELTILLRLVLFFDVLSLSRIFFELDLNFFMGMIVLTKYNSRFTPFFFVKKNSSKLAKPIEKNLAVVLIFKNRKKLLPKNPKALGVLRGVRISSAI